MRGWYLLHCWCLNALCWLLAELGSEPWLAPCAAFSETAIKKAHLPAAQVVSKLYQSAYFPPARETVLASLFAMLLSRLYTAAQNDLVDTLFRLVGICMGG